MKTALTIKDRVYIPAILPKEGAMIEMITVRGIIKKVEFTPEEIEGLNIRDSEKGVTWAKDKTIEVEFTATEKEILVKSIKQMDEEKKIPLDMLPTAEKLFSSSYGV